MSTLRDFFPPVTPATQPFMQVQQQLATGTAAGASVVGDNHRDLNTVLHNDIVGASLASNQITVPIGTYMFDIAMSNGASGLSLPSLVDVGDSSKKLVGLNANANVDCQVSGVVTFPVATTLKVNQYCSVAKATDGLGLPVGQAPYEVYCIVNIWLGLVQ